MTCVVLAYPGEDFEEAGHRALREAVPSVSLTEGFCSEVLTFDNEQASGGSLGEYLLYKRADVVTVGPGIGLEQAVELVQQIEQACPGIGVVLVHEPTAAAWRSALHAGAHDVLDPGANAETIRAAIDRVSKIVSDRRARIATHLPVATESAPSGGRILTVVSPKGGSGKTVVATNVAVSLAKRLPGDVVLVDLDLQFGDVASSLGLTPQYTMYTATQASGSESALLKAFLTPHSSHLLVLCAPDDPTEADEIKEGDAVSIVKELSKLFAWVIVDTGAGLDDLTLAMAEVATDLVFVSSTDVPSVRGIRKEAMIMDQLGVRARRHFVLNRSDARVGLLASDITATTGLPVVAEVPSSRSVPTAVNVGVPIVEHDSRNPAAKGLVQFADYLLAGETPSAKGLKRFLR